MSWTWVREAAATASTTTAAALTFVQFDATFFGGAAFMSFAAFAMTIAAEFENT